jgi:hypothetical protein
MTALSPASLARRVAVSDSGYSTPAAAAALPGSAADASESSFGDDFFIGQLVAATIAEGGRVILLRQCLSP